MKLAGRYVILRILPDRQAFGKKHITTFNQ